MVAIVQNMAKRTVTTTTIVDDLDGKLIEDGQADSVRFSLDGTHFEIDLSTANARAFRDVLSPYTKVATIVTARRSSNGASKSNKEELAAARQWLNSNGHVVLSRGRIAGDLMDLYRSSK